ncbi:fluoride efflux transporter CrcB [Salarchaeum japonicum]|uniref:Fluoride-specific ion channel FluC n=1 Tax=Salarchaeum japonicum TaxID=555573 RepID=A0AAV3T402_9EURY|nr:fluoride efflux transporter CrcB [Salarchaeum japonicum]
MDVPPAQLVGAGGALGALARYYVGVLVPETEFPRSTLAVNVLGSFALALLTFANASDTWLLFLGTGACGAFTTFSSFAYETVRLAEDGRPRVAAANALLNLVGSFAAVGVAWAAASL